MSTIGEFQMRRRKMWWLGIPWILIGTVGFGASAYFGGNESAESLLVTAASLASVVAGVLIVARIYRCPSCGAVPGLDNGTVLLNPGQCPSCGVALR